jgi:hypothetical protein
MNQITLNLTPPSMRAYEFSDQLIAKVLAVLHLGEFGNTPPGEGSPVVRFTAIMAAYNKNKFTLEEVARMIPLGNQEPWVWGLAMTQVIEFVLSQGDHKDNIPDDVFDKEPWRPLLLVPEDVGLRNIILYHLPAHPGAEEKVAQILNDFSVSNSSGT